MITKVLIVDDDPIFLEIISTFLKEKDFDVLSATNGSEGLNLAKEHKPNIIITDINMPVMDGIQMTKEIRMDKSLLETSVIMLTARDQLTAKLEGFEAGTDDFLTKPFELDELYARVKAVERIINLRNKIAELEKTKLLVEMAGAMAHELNQPLGVIIGYADFILGTIEKSNEFYKPLKKILDNAEKMSEIIKKISKIRKYETKDYVGTLKILDIDKSSDENTLQE